MKKTPTFIFESGTYTVPAGASHFHLKPTTEVLEATIVLDVVGSELVLTGAITIEEGSSNVEVTLLHRAAQTKANVLVKTLATGSAAASFKGLLSISPNTQNCQSYLTHQSLLFDNAKSKSWPALEIANNEVACSHAATSRTITEKDLYYLRSRGLSASEARTLLVEAFLSDVTY